MAKRKIRAFYRQFFGTISDVAFIGVMIALSYIIPAEPRRGHGNVAFIGR